MSAEMSLPNNTPEEKEKWRQILTYFFPSLNLNDPNINPNKPIIEEWKQTIDFFGQTFHEKTIVLTQGSGLFSFIPKQKHNIKAREEILKYFVANSSSIGKNSKAIQTSGLKACRGQGGIARVKELTKNPLFSPRILGGVMFNSSVSRVPVTMGCLECIKQNQCNGNHECCELTPSQALMNVLQKYFQETPYASQYCNTEEACGNKDDSLMHYLQIYKQDVLASETDSKLQTLLEKASRDILSMSQLPAPSLSPYLSPPLSLSPTPPAGTAQSPKGVFALIGWNKTPKKETLKNVNVDGLVIRTYWRDVNPKQEVYNWVYLDSQFEKARQNNKKVHLIIAPGFRSPQWVLNQIPTANLEIPYGHGQGKLQDFPIPWNETYLSLWFSFINKVAERYGSHPSLGFISAVGPNSHNGEMSLPKKGKDNNGNPITWLDLVEGQSEKEKIYNLKHHLKGSWDRTFRAFNTAFYGKMHFTLALAIRPVPVRWVDADEQERYKTEIINQAIKNFTLSFGLQSNGLDARPLWPDQEPNWNWETVGSHSKTIFTGFQTNAPSKLYPKNPNSNDPSEVEILQQTVENALTRKVKFLEIYESDIIDFNKQTVIRYAHDRLTGSATPYPSLTPITTSPQLTPTLWSKPSPSPTGHIQILN